MLKNATFFYAASLFYLAFIYIIN